MKQMKRILCLVMVIVVISSILLLSGCQNGAQNDIPNGTSNGGQSNGQDSNQGSNQGGNQGGGKRKYTSEEIFANCKDSVAEIKTFNKKGEGLSLGSGFVIDEAGLIVTNFHVIDEAYSIEVNLSGVKYQVTHIEKYDSDVDIAVLRIAARNLKKLTMSNDDYTDGSVVYTIGSSEGYTLSFSNGVIASKERVFDGVKYIQHSSPISHGNSGGPLINEYGEVIGINTSSNIEGQNLNFAIKVEEINKLPTKRMRMSEFYTKEGPYYEVFIGDYKVKETEPNNQMSSAQVITVNGTTIVGNVNRQYDIDWYKVTVPAGEKLNVLFVPDYSIDASGVLCGLWDHNENVLAAAVKTTISGITLQAMFYENNTSVAQTFYVALFYDRDYAYKNTICEYALFLYSK